MSTDACDDADTLDGADVKDRSPQPDDNSEPTLHRRVRKVPRPAVRGVPQVPQREPGHRGQYLASRERPRGDR